jgi:hypothetical protein
MALATGSHMRSFFQAALKTSAALNVGGSIAMVPAGAPTAGNR